MKAILLLLTFILTGCSTIDVKDVNQIANETTIKYDQYDALYTINGLDYKLNSGIFDSHTIDVRLRGTLNEDGSGKSFQLYIFLWGDYYLSPKSASDISGNALVLKEIGSGRSAWWPDTVMEKLVVDLTYEYLMSHRDVGINIRIKNDISSTIVTLPGIYVRAFLDGYNKLKP
ncbi:hypothetical protein [Candidatus Thioglobus sp.]|uniref:hypothetical protein n=1 Tax=Candidatus Thioglobus sp. TaxID=2026721 RepID=UPI00175B3EA0|nr:hypothetical protein [Candidatus Thioglobus sp.]HIF47267.1 hypothetical protein [Candidatus Thioglobus sp.]